MLEEIYGWLQNISVYLIVMAAVMHAIPGKDYGKYIRFFSGLVLILMLSSPLLRLAGMEGTFRTLYKGKEYEIGEDGSRDSVQDDGQNEGMIEVEEIEIGK